MPTVAEQGYPGFETSQWYGLNAPAKTPKASSQLAVEAAKAAKTARSRALRGRRREGGGSTPAEYAAFIKKEQERWSKVVKAAQIRIE